MSNGEGKYFLEKSVERRRKVRRDMARAAAEAAQREAIGEKLHTTDEALVEAVRALGFDGDTVRVFDLLPLIHVAWADGRIQRGERAGILAILEQRGIKPESEAWVLVESLLEERPSAEFLDQTLDLLKQALGEQGDNAGSIVELCFQVADAAGGVLGFASVSGEEKELIRKIADTLGKDAQDAFMRKMS